MVSNLVKCWRFLLKHDRQEGREQILVLYLILCIGLLSVMAIIITILYKISQKDNLTYTDYLLYHLIPSLSIINCIKTILKRTSLKWVVLETRFLK